MSRLKQIAVLPALTLALVFPLLTGSAQADTIACPELASAVQVGACPGEDELRLTYRGFCSDNQRMYDKEQVCLEYGIYRAAKNISLWESPDGRFSGYLSCDMSAQSRASARPAEIKLTRQGSLTLLACIYSNDAKLTYRTRSACVATVTTCAGDSAACTASCE